MNIVVNSIMHSALIAIHRTEQLECFILIYWNILWNYTYSKFYFYLL